MTTFATSTARGLAALVVSAGMLVGVSAQPAAAGHDDVVIVKKNQPVCYLDEYGTVVLTKSVKKLSKFERGFYEGMSDGSEIGFEDGFHGARFCDVPRRRFEYPHRMFPQGYAEGFSLAYARSFDRGRHEVSHRRVTRHRIDPYRRGPGYRNPYRNRPVFRGPARHTTVERHPLRHLERWVSIRW